MKEIGYCHIRKRFCLRGKSVFIPLCFKTSLMNRFLIVFLLSFCLVGCQLKNQSENLFYDAKHNISFYYPNKWKKIENNDKCIFASIIQNNTDFNDSFNVTVDTLNSNETHETHFKHAVEYFMSNETGISDLKISDTTINNYRCFSLSFKLEREQQKTLCKIYSFYVVNHCFRLTFLSKDFGKTLTQKDIDGILSSISFSNIN